MNDALFGRSLLGTGNQIREKPMKAAITVGAIIVGVGSAYAAVGAKTVKKVSFEACLETIRVTAQNIGAAPTNIVETSGLRVVRLPAAEGSVLVTCDRSAGTMTLVPSTRTCGVDVNC